MMKEVIIQNLGPIDECKISCTSTMIFTGAQASGKSTIAKAIYLGYAIKDELYNSFVTYSTELIPETVAESFHNNIMVDFEQRLRRIFFKLFGPVWTIRKNAKLQFLFHNYYSITLRMAGKERLEVLLSSTFEDLIVDTRNAIAKAHPAKDNQHQMCISALEQVFSEFRTPIFIPAARSIMTSLGNQFGYLYAIMGDRLRDSLDYGTQTFIETALSVRPEFSSGISGLETESAAIRTRDAAYLTKYNTMMELAQNVVKGSYRQISGEDRLYIKGGQFVKLNYASSGQQEAVWIINLIAYHFIKGKQAVYIIEEPETHLYPDAQRQIANFIALAKNMGNSVIVTTHSPYILGAFNNLLYAGNLADKNTDRNSVEKIIPSCFWLDGKDTQAFYVEDGGIKNAIEQGRALIDNELIDGASDEINKEFDKLADIDGVCRL